MTNEYYGFRLIVKNTSASSFAVYDKEKCGFISKQFNELLDAENALYRLRENLKFGNIPVEFISI